MKTLIIVSHPKYKDSATQSFLKKAVSGFENITWHNLDKDYQNGNIDVAKEQQLLRENDRIIFQFPMYWYSAPQSLKYWQDEVLTRYFAYANESGSLKGKELGIVTSVGYPENQFQAGSSEGFSISEIMIPYRALAKITGMKYMSTLVISQFAYMQEEEKAELLIKYQEYVSASYPLTFDKKQTWFENQLAKLNQQNLDINQIRLIVSQLKDNQDLLNDLKWQIKLMRQDEED